MINGGRMSFLSAPDLRGLLEGGVHIEPFYTVMGFAPTKYGLGIVGRASQKQVVNVAQRGGMCGILIGRPPGRLVGPGGSHR